MTRFVILAAPRTGSNLLCTMLNGHPQILCHHEIFNPGGIFYALDHRDGSLDLGSISDRNRDPRAFLDKLWAHALGYDLVGFKLTRGQGEVILEHVLRDPTIRKVVLHRRNRVKAFVSSLIAERLDEWEVYSEEQLVRERPLVRVEIRELMAHASLNERFYNAILTCPERDHQLFIELDYESLFRTDEQRRLLDFLGAERVPLAGESVKQNPTDLRTLVANFSELDDLLSGSPFHAELHDRQS